MICNYCISLLPRFLLSSGAGTSSAPKFSVTRRTVLAVVCQGACTLTWGTRQRGVPASRGQKYDTRISWHLRDGAGLGRSETATR